MKRLFALLLLLVSGLSAATTLSPIQLLNPSGSSSGQALVSTGASSAPAWGGVGVNGIAAIAANAVLANATGSSASPTAFAMPSCSTSASALNWTSGSGFTCNTAVNAAQLGGATFAAPGPIGSTTASTGAFTTLSATSTVSGAGFSTYLASPPAIGTTTPAAGKFTTLQATSTITPSTAAAIVGTTAADNANAGSIGEFLTGNSSGGSLTNNTWANATSVSLSAGDWDVWGTVQFNPSGSTTVSRLLAAISTTSASAGATYAQQQDLQLTFTTGAAQTLATPVTRINVSSTTPVYLTVFTSFGVSTMTANGTIYARRRR